MTSAASIGIKLMRDRVVLPMGTGVPIMRGQIAVITSASQKHAWVVTRLFISGSGTSGGAGDWCLRSIRVNGREKLKKPISGDLFAVGEVWTWRWSDLHWRARAGGRVVMTVEYVGRKRRGCPFFAAIVGLRARRSRQVRRRGEFSLGH